MHYQISRNGQMYGPYTLEDLQRYVASGNVLLTDMAKSDEMTDWVPVSQLLSAAGEPAAAAAAGGFSNPGFTNPGFANPPFTAPGYPDQGYPPADFPPQGLAPGLAASPFQDAPNLHWGLVLLFTILTCGLFMPIWNLIVNAWLKRVQPNATSLMYWIGVAVLFICYVFANGSNGSHHALAPGLHVYSDHPLASLILVAMFIVKLVARYSERASLEEHFNGPEPVGLQLSGVMTFFFGGLYFQYHLNRINAMKQAARFGAGRAF